MNLLEFILLFTFGVLAYKLVFALTKRASAHLKISSLRKTCGMKVKNLRIPLSSLFLMKSTPDIVVEDGETIYVCRFVSGVSGYRFVHFASEEYLVRYTKSRILLGGRLRIKAERGAFLQGAGVYENKGTGVTSARSVVYMPKMKLPEEYRESEFSTKKVVPVLIFSPSPCEVSYVTEKRNRIKVAFTGDEFYGYKLFTPSTFAIYAERMKRQREYEKEKAMRGHFI